MTMPSPAPPAGRLQPFRRSPLLPLSLGSLLLLSVPASVEAVEDPILSARGDTGLVTVPGAFFPAAPAVAAGAGVAWDRSQIANSQVAALWPVDGLEIGLARHGKTPAASARLRLWREGRWHPALAIGGRYRAGDASSAEYLTLGKRWRQVDVTFGLGWGRLGAGGGAPNPLARLGDRFRRPRTGSGPTAWFSGDRVAPFGGLEVHTGFDGLSLQIEVTGEAADPPPESADRSHPWAINAGVAYRPWSWLTLGVAVERGERAVARLAVRPPMSALAAAAPVVPEPRRWSKPAGHADFAAAGVAAQDLRIDHTTAAVWIDPTASTAGLAPARAIGRAARVLSGQVPDGVAALTVVAGSHGLSGTAVTLSRAALARADRRRGSPAELLAEARLTPPDHPDSAPGPAPWSDRLTAAVIPQLQQSMKAVAGRVPLRASADLALDYQLDTHWTLGNALRINFGDTLALPSATAVAPARQARGDLALYTQTQPIRLERMFAAWRASLTPSWHAGATVGHFEEMFGGIGGELLYQAFAARWAVGVDLSQVWKRMPGDDLRLIAGSGRPTGHATLYLEGPGNAWTGTLGIGRYLAGDRGATITLTRDTGLGVQLGGFATWTTSPPSGPAGSTLDAGLRLSLPFGRLSILPRRSRFNLEIVNLAQDRGQRLARPLPLYETRRDSAPGRVLGTWNQVLE